jgi:YHS domain-containing protein
MKSKILFSLALLLAVSTFALAQKKSDNIFQTDAGAIKGYDPVAYFTDSKPVKGNTAFKTDWNGATWYFASAEHLAVFKADPTKYAPQYGGYCAYGMSEEHKAPVEPEAWSIVNGKLYLNYNSDVPKEWKKKDSDLIIKADANWAKIKK